MVLGTLGQGVASAQQTGSGIYEVTIVPRQGTEIVWRNRSYVGALNIGTADKNLVLVEEVDLDGYLRGIHEVPLSWPDETLAAQVVAARTYLAWTMARGRSSSGRKYEFDICATTQCQVYGGSSPGDSVDELRWDAEIARTSREILLYEDSPAQALYSSSAGSRTRAIQDIWGASAKPYLQPVDSPELDVTPYRSWTVVVPADAFRRVVAMSGFTVGGDITDVSVVGPGEGEGPSQVEIRSELGITSIAVSRIRAIFNVHGPTLYPGLFPGPRPSGRRWPQTILSYTFETHVEGENPSAISSVSAFLPASDRPTPLTVVFDGEGWGHAIGMSQWGIKAMGDNGWVYDDMLAHYYGGLRPEDGGRYIPDTVRIGLTWTSPSLLFEATGSFDLWVNGSFAGVVPGGEWTFDRSSNGIRLTPPVGAEIVVALLTGKHWPR
ncbi:MAG: SpoIID/LytB domain-containing protein [Acidobacteria bacterium]|nr:SpoIID/LytB domain-containing protein [Acidobacteriota bacterium]